ncbi:MAG: hypothetical protein ABIC19_00565 [Patescibacteria group bacterium]|nr:hypothetical protein [Patescibacteria group bacterium]
MKETLTKLFSNTIGKIIKTELSSDQGKINLLGGIVGSIIFVILFATDFIETLINAVLTFFGKSLLPSLSPMHMIIGLILILAYFLLCVRYVSDN